MKTVSTQLTFFFGFSIFLSLGGRMKSSDDDHHQVKVSSDEWSTKFNRKKTD